MIYQKLQSGKQVGTDKRIDKSGVFYWYSYAVQKVDDETGSLVWAVLSKWKGIYHFSAYYASLEALERGM